MIQGVCVQKVIQAWNVIVNNFQVLNLFIKPTKYLCDWDCITIPCDADMFHDCSTLFSITKWSSFSERNVLMGACRPRCEVWGVFQPFSTSHLSCCVNSKQKFTIIRVQNFLSKYFSFILLSFPSRFFQIIKFFSPFFSNCCQSSSIAGLYFNLCVKK